MDSCKAVPLGDDDDNGGGGGGGGGGAGKEYIAHIAPGGPVTHEEYQGRLVTSGGPKDIKVGRCRLIVSKPALEAPLVSVLEAKT